MCLFSESVCAGVNERRERASDSLEIELLVIVNMATGTKLNFFAKAKLLKLNF